jgi:hypothetical protein
MFENVQVKDKVWSFIYGWGTVVEVDILLFKVEYDKGGYSYYNKNGKLGYNLDEKPTLF